MNKFLSCGLMVLMVLPAFAAETGNIVVTTTAQFEEVTVNEAGEETTRLVDVTTVVPGDQVIYTVTFRNIGEQPAERVTITDPIPEEMAYVDGSVFGPGTDITFSVDGGNTFAAAEELTVLDDVGNERTAQAADYTHIRWVMRNALPPGEQGYARFRAILR